MPAQKTKITNRLLWRAISAKFLVLVFSDTAVSQAAAEQPNQPAAPTLLYSPYYSSAPIVVYQAVPAPVPPSPPAPSAPVPSPPVASDQRQSAPVILAADRNGAAPKARPAPGRESQRHWEGLYLQLNGGGVFTQDLTDTVPLGGGFTTRIRSDFDVGYAISAAVGVKSEQGLRLELEVAYSEATADITVSADLLPGSITGKATWEHVNATLGLFYDFQNTTPLTPYIGVGAGISSVRIKNLRLLGENFGNSQHNEYFVGFGEVGIELQIASAVSIVPAYRFQWVALDRGRDDVFQHQARAGLRVHF